MKPVQQKPILKQQKEISYLVERDHGKSWKCFRIMHMRSKS